jgi:predicted PurR-regulated permease PerM
MKQQRIRPKQLRAFNGRWFRNRRAVSAVISNMLLIAAVIVVGFVAIGFAQSMSENYRSTYGHTINSDINKLKENVAFEFCQYNANTKQLTVYFLNAGNVNFEIKSVSINSSPLTSFPTYQMSDNQQITNHVVASGIEAYLVLDLSGQTVPNGTNTVKITTGSGSNFVYDFTA